MINQLEVIREKAIQMFGVEDYFSAGPRENYMMLKAARKELNKQEKEQE